MSSIFQEIHNLKSNIQSKGEMPYQVVGIVTNNNDPLNERRIKVVLPSKGGTIESDWLRCKVATHSVDNPLPKVGQLAVVEFIDSNPHLGVWTGILINQSNQPLNKVDAINDRSVDVPGNETLTVGETFRLSNKSGAFIELSHTGYVLIGDAFGNRWMLGQDGINVSGGTINFTDVGNVSINNKSVATIGATDTRGDTLVTRGY